MKSCEHYEELCSRYLELELSAAERKDFEEHLNSCPSCREKLEDIRLIRQRLKKLKPITTTPDFETVLRAQIQMSKHMGRFGRSPYWPLPAYLRWPALGLAAALLVFAVTFLFQRGSDFQWFRGLSPATETFATPSSPSISTGNIFYSLELVPLPQKKTHAENQPKAQERQPVSGQAGGEAVHDSVQIAKEAREKAKRYIRTVSF